MGDEIGEREPRERVIAEATRIDFRTVDAWNAEAALDVAIRFLAPFTVSSAERKALLAKLPSAETLEGRDAILRALDAITAPLVPEPGAPAGVALAHPRAAVMALRVAVETLGDRPNAAMTREARARYCLRSIATAYDALLAAYPERADELERAAELIHEAAQ